MPKILLAHLSFCPESFYLAKGNGKRLNAYSLRLFIVYSFFLGSLNPFMDRFQMPYIPPQFTTHSGLHIFIKLIVVFVGDATLVPRYSLLSFTSSGTQSISCIDAIPIQWRLFVRGTCPIIAHKNVRTYKIMLPRLVHSRHTFVMG